MKSMTPETFLTLVPLLCIQLLTPSVLAATSRAQDNEQQEVMTEQSRLFEARIRPLLIEHCCECHGTTKQKGGLRLDSLEAMTLGGESGPAVVPGKPDESLLISAIRHESFEMPPSGKLPEAAIDQLTQWVQQGAYWPEGETGPVSGKRTAGQEFTPADRAWWAIQPLSMAEPPQVENMSWVRNEIDRFVVQKQLEHGLHPAQEANRVSLIRRLYFDLTGLPPAPEEVAEFVSSSDPLAWEKLVDRLLESPEYGERWGRHWLDLVRYADSDGYRIDHFRPDAWRYRDYVIQSLNEDKPYDRFVQEQIAGDEMFPDDPDAQTATGFLRHWIYEYNNRDVRGQWDIILNEVTDATGDVFLGLGMQCARCHDHKFDPILQKDYYQLRAYFEPLMPADVIVASKADQDRYNDQYLKWEAATSEIRAKLEELQMPVRELAKNEAVSRFPEEIQAVIAKPEDQRTSQEKQLVALAWRQVLYEYERLDDRFRDAKKDQLLELRRELAKFDSLKPASLPVAMAVRDVSGQAPLTVIPKRKTQVEPGVLTLLGQDVPIEPLGDRPTTGRRTALAKWMTQPSNPLTTRVIVNRIWQYHFGRGLAENSSDFGQLGGPPTHPELLDWLTNRLIAEGWRMKSLHRLILNSATWRQSSAHQRMDEFQQIDPLNRLYWRSNTRRLDAEQIRDSILAASGTLDRTHGGVGEMSDSNRRSIYLRYMRNERDSLLDVFDLPLFFNSSATRDTTTSPVQALMMFNSETLLQHAATLSNRVENDVTASRHTEHGAVTGNNSTGDTMNNVDRVHRLWQIAYGREPDSHELEEALNFLREQAAAIASEQVHSAVNSVPLGRLPYRDGQSLLIQPDLKQPPVMVPAPKLIESESLTIEVYFQIRSVYDTGAVRTLISQWNGSPETPGWAFGVTGKGSRRKPQTLVLQVFGRDGSGKLIEAAIFSDQHIELNNPYYAAVVLRLPRSSATGAGAGAGSPDSAPGEATFYLKDLANADEPVLTARIPHAVVGGIHSDLPLVVGSRAKSDETSFDGLIDDIRLSLDSLTQNELLLTSESLHPKTVGYWKFETVPGILRDSSSGEQHLVVSSGNRVPLPPNRAAFEDLCHAVINSSRFLYVD